MTGTDAAHHLEGGTKLDTTGETTGLGVLGGTIAFQSNDSADNCETQREARAGGVKLNGCDMRVVLGRFAFRVR